MLNELQYLAVGKNGSYADSGDYQTDAIQVEKIVEHIKEYNIDELVLYFHGGLVSEISGAGSIQNMINQLQTGDPSRHVMGVIWKTGFKETLQENLTDIFSSKQGKNLLRWVIRIASKKLKIPSVKSGAYNGFSFNEIDEEIYRCTNGAALFDGVELQINSVAKNYGAIDEQELIDLAREELELFEYDPGFRQLWEDIPKSVTVNDDLLDDDNAKGLFSTVKLAGAIGKLAYKVIKRFINKTDHGFHATVVEEICRAYYISDVGQWAWGEMKDKAEQMWSIDSGPCKDFLVKLERAVPGIKLQLIGHSAGSICISHLLNKIEQNSWKFNVDNIFWLAPAATSKLFKKEVIDKPGRYKKFRMFTMADAYERKDTLVPSVPWLYPSSLLYCIAGILEDNTDYSLSGMARYHTGEKPYNNAMHKAVQAFLDPYGVRVFSPSPAHAPVGFQTKSLSHGGFDDDRFTLSSLAHVLSGEAILEIESVVAPEPEPV